MYTYYAQVTGTPTALAAGGDSEVYVVAYGHANHTGDIGTMATDFKKKFNDDYYTLATYNGINLMSAAMAQSEIDRPCKSRRCAGRTVCEEFCGGSANAQV